MSGQHQGPVNIGLSPSLIPEETDSTALRQLEYAKYCNEKIPINQRIGKMILHLDMELVCAIH